MIQYYLNSDLYYKVQYIVKELMFVPWFSVERFDKAVTMTYIERIFQNWESLGLVEFHFPGLQMLT